MPPRGYRDAAAAAERRGNRTACERAVSRREDSQCALWVLPRYTVAQRAGAVPFFASIRRSTADITRQRHAYGYHTSMSPRSVA